MYDINWNFDLKILFKVIVYLLIICIVYVKYYLKCIYLFFEKIYGLDYILCNISSRLYV